MGRAKRKRKRKTVTTTTLLPAASVAAAHTTQAGLYHIILPKTALGGMRWLGRFYPTATSHLHDACVPTGKTNALRKKFVPRDRHVRPAGRLM
jgi:hypothetical protein